MAAGDKPFAFGRETIFLSIVGPVKVYSAAKEIDFSASKRFMADFMVPNDSLREPSERPDAEPHECQSAKQQCRA